METWNRVLVPLVLLAVVGGSPPAPARAAYGPAPGTLRSSDADPEPNDFRPWPCGVGFSRCGIVFVHGKGPATLGIPAEARAYWGEPMINAVTVYQSVPYIVTACNGTWNYRRRADCAAQQVLAFLQRTGVQRLVFIAHSFGGIVTRELVSQPLLTWRSCGSTCFGERRLEYERSLAGRMAIYQRFEAAWTIGSPHLGSEAADMAWWLRRYWGGASLVMWAGQSNQATFECRTGPMARYNRTRLLGTWGRPDLPGAWSHIAANAYPIELRNDGRHPEDLQLVLLAGMLPFPGGSDGLVSYRSASAVGDLRLDRGVRETANHHHNRRYYDSNRYIGDALGYLARQWNF